MFFNGTPYCLTRSHLLVIISIAFGLRFICSSIGFHMQVNAIFDECQSNGHKKMTHIFPYKYQLTFTSKIMPERLHPSSVQLSCSVVSNSFRPHKLQHARPPCPSPTPGVHPNSCPLSRWCHPTISSSVVPFSSRLQSFQASVFSNKSTLHIRWPKYWSFSFSISPSNKHPGLISFRMDWLVLLAVQGTLKSLLQHHSSKASIFRCSTFLTVQLSHPYMTIVKTKALTR